LPNLINILQPWKGHAPPREQVEHTARLINLVLPPGWLPLGAATLAEGNFLAPLLCMLGMGLIGTGSLWRAYRTTLRLYTGQFSSGKAAPAPAEAPRPVQPAPAEPARVGNFLEKRLPWVSEQASVIALGSLRSLLRAPEAKMMLLTPVILVVVFGSLFLAQSVQVPAPLRPLTAFGALAMTLLTMGQLVGNQFAFDRGGFRVYVLSAVPRREILLGKNLSFAPLALGMGAVMLIALQVLYPMRVDHFLAALAQFVSMFLLYCMLANLMSIIAPLPIRAGSFKPVNAKGVPMLLQILFALLFPFALLPALLPLGIEYALEEMAGVKGVPLCLLLSVAECALVIAAYRLVLTWEGAALQANELKVLDTVTTKAE
jgi:hypothetical protein